MLDKKGFNLHLNNMQKYLIYLFDSFKKIFYIIILSFIIAGQKKSKSIMTSLKMFDILLSVLLIWQIILRTALTLPLDGGYGGVYNSPEANAYWARRFGSGFLKSSQSRSAITKIKNVNRVASFKPSFRVEESFRSSSNDFLKQVDRIETPEIKVHATKQKVESSNLVKDDRTPNERTVVNSTKISKKEKSSKRKNGVNRAIKMNDSTSQNLKKKYLKRYFSRKIQ